jgi:hypothetical protein
VQAQLNSLLHVGTLISGFKGYIRKENGETGIWCLFVANPSVPSKQSLHVLQTPRFGCSFHCFFGGK